MWSVLAQITVNILQFLSIEGQRQITEMCWHKSQLTYYNFFSTRRQGQKCGTCWDILRILRTKIAVLNTCNLHHR